MTLLPPLPDLFMGYWLIGIILFGVITIMTVIRFSDSKYMPCVTIIMMAFIVTMTAIIAINDYELNDEYNETFADIVNNASCTELKQIYQELRQQDMAFGYMNTDDLEDVKSKYVFDCVADKSDAMEWMK